ncbi:MAG: tail fiber domain-containing protein [Bacteroidota bacterium]
MAERSKSYLKQEFRDGERPTGADFGDFIDSFLNKVDDSINFDAEGNLDIPNGINLGNVPSGQTGTLRFNAGQVQFFDGATWNDLGGGGGAFSPVGPGPNVSFNGGNVGIDTGASDPAYKLEVSLGNNTGQGERVKFGRAVISNGQGASQNYGQFSHETHSSNNSFAIRQGTSGDVFLNAPSGQPIRITHNRTQARLFVAPEGPVVIANNSLLSTNTQFRLQVNGNAGKSQGGNTWSVISDARLKKDIKPFEDGLNKLKKVRPVKFRYNGQLNTDPNQEEIGVVGQEIGKVFPYMTSGEQNNETGKKDDEVVMFNSHALTYVMVNAIKELSKKVEELETRLKLQF